ncbi:MAG: HAMP domain-containing histidine kinase [Phaeodactylibacter sp.]|nr:HAMP domain-containing histidine kinase [Phaeodactylibacter sp.]
MERPRNIRLRLLSYGVIAYMMLAFAWWSVLLFIKNRDAYEAKRDTMRLMMIAREEIPPTDEAFYNSPAFTELKKQYENQEYMILGEASVFVLSLAIGVWLINRGYHKEVMAAQQQRNFLLSITHELKSPLASIRLVLETFQRRELPRDKAASLTRNALLETERLNKLVNDLLLSAKLESAYQLHQEPVNLAQLVEDIFDQMEAKYPKASFTFNKKTAVEDTMGDVAGLSSVVINLLENAVKYSGEDADIEACISQSGNTVRMEVSDQGIGIEDQEKERIFEKFYRIGSEDTRKTKGTGLGLYIVNEIVKAHKGKIAVLDNEPRGTIFRVEIPVMREKVKQKATDNQP